MRHWLGDQYLPVLHMRDMSAGTKRHDREGVSGILCKRGGHQISEMRSPNSMVNLVSAAFQSRMGSDHF